MEGGILSVDDTVLDKPHSQEGKTDLVGYFWSGLHGKAVKGINLVTLFYRDPNGAGVPVSFRVVDKKEGKTKNDLFREMVAEVLEWGLRPSMVSADSWYSGLENLKFLRKKELGFLIALEKNRIVSQEAHEYVAVEGLELPEAGKVVHLREFGFVSVFRTVDKNNAVRHYAAFDPRKKSASRATIAPSSRSAEPRSSSCASKGPSATTSFVSCALSRSWTCCAGAARSKAGTRSNATSPMQQ